MCIICRKEYNDDTTILVIEECPDLQEIPFLSNLKKFIGYHCPNLQKIPLLPNLELLYCHGTISLQPIPLLPNLLYLDIPKCKLYRLPLLPKLEKLVCYMCPNIEIPPLPSLKYLDCSHCPNLQEIPSLPNLEILYSDNCPKLQRISKLPKLRILECFCCPRLVYQPNFASVHWIENCPWIQGKNIFLIQNIQKKLRKWLNFLVYIRNPKYSAWLYAPNGPLGWKSRKMLEGIVFRKD